MSSSSGPTKPWPAVLAFVGIMLMSLAPVGVTRADDIPVARLVQETLAAGKTADFLVVLKDNPAG
jgi:hypothetical protein